MHCVSPVNRSRQNAAGFSAENRPVQSFSVMTHEIEAGRSAGEHRHAELFPIGTYVSPWRPVGTARQRSSLREFPAGNSAKCSADLNSKQQPTISAVNHYCVSAQRRLRTSSSKKTRGGSRTGMHWRLPTGSVRHPQRALMAIAESEYVLVAEIFRICVFSSSYVAISKRLTTSLLK